MRPNWKPKWTASQHNEIKKKISAKIREKKWRYLKICDNETPGKYIYIYILAKNIDSPFLENVSFFTFNLLKIN